MEKEVITSMMQSQIELKTEWDCVSIQPVIRNDILLWTFFNALKIKK